MNPPDSLYKYVTIERVDIFTNGRIRFTQPAALNDPFELVPLLESLLPEERIEEVLEPNFEFLKEALRRQYKGQPSNFQAAFSEDTIVELVKNSPDLQKRFYRQFEPTLRHFLSSFLPEAKSILRDVMAKKIGILSLSEEIDNVLLWSHYSNSHKGFAIEFNARHQFFNRKRGPKDELYHLRKVIYQRKSSKGKTLENIDGDELLCSKDLHWQYEKEWRVLAQLDDAQDKLVLNDDEIYLFELPLDSINRVILGANITPASIGQLYKCLEQAGLSSITISKAVLDIDNQQVVVK